MSRFKVGQTVYMGRGDKMRELVVAKIHDNPLIPVYQYSFEAPHDGFACGEQSIRETPDGEDLRISDCYKDGVVEARDKSVSTMVNTIMAGGKKSLDFDEFGLGNSFSDCNLFFKPSLGFVEWLKGYADGRMIIDVGSGQGHLVRMLKMTGAKAMGLEPNFDVTEFIKWRMHVEGRMPDVNEILPMTVQQAKGIIEGMGADKAMLVFARPCHSSFVEEGIYNMPEGMEALYITVPENLELYRDLGMFHDKAEKLEHKGVSEDDEVVYSVVREKKPL